MAHAQNAQPQDGHANSIEIRAKIVEILGGLARQVWLMALIFVVLFAIGLFVALKMPVTYQAGASLLVQTGPDYVYQPAVGDAARGAITDSEVQVLAEAEIIQSAELYKRVISRVGFQRLFPKSPALWNPKSATAKAEAEAAGIKYLAKHITVVTGPKNNVMRLGFRHENAETAALVLNTLIDTYVQYRRDVFVDQQGALLQQQKSAIDTRLDEVNQAYRGFLAQNGGMDFATAKATYTKIYDQAMTDLFNTQTLIAQGRAKLDQINAGLEQVKPEIGVERSLDLSLPGKIRDLKAQRDDLLTRYLPDAEPVVALDNQIAAFEGRLKSDGVDDKEVKLGRNPLYQDLISQKYNTESDLASLNSRRKQLEAQILEVMNRMQTFYGMDAKNSSLNSERDALQNQIRDFSTRIQDNEAANEVAKGGNDVVRIISPAIPPSESKSLKKPVAILAFLFAGFTALCAGLLRSLLQRGFYNVDMVARTLDLPILAQARFKPK
jgi:uncharacterized protein involved in exopolysaccharide biosynthesis